MIVDSSALAAIMFREPDAETHKSLLRAEGALLSAASYVELSMVVDGRSSVLLTNGLDPMLEQLGVEIVPFTADQARIARDAFRRYGRGSGHPARLNFGDCIAYALAIERGEPLLFKGNDFAQTDVVPAIPPTQ